MEVGGRSYGESAPILTVRGAQLIAVPAAFTLATTRDHWEALVRARATENQAFGSPPITSARTLPDSTRAGAGRPAAYGCPVEEAA